MKVAPLCGALYTRPDQTVLRCTYLANHPIERHSWWTVQAQDDVEVDKTDYTPTAVQAFIDAIDRGVLDEYIEAILAAGHHRKLARRGVIGFIRVRDIRL